jgi:hypothetical protein
MRLHAKGAHFRDATPENNWGLFGQGSNVGH